MAWSTILVEILGGLAVMLGAFVTLASLPMAAVLLVAMFTVHLRDLSPEGTGERK
jgi:putative oxidoreductase